MGGRVAIEWFLMRAFAADSSSPPSTARVLFKDLSLSKGQVPLGLLR